MSRSMIPLLPLLALLAAACTSEKGAPPPAPAARPVEQGKVDGRLSPSEAKLRATPTPTNEAGQIEIEANADGFTPNRIYVEEGKPVKLLVTRTVERTCMDGIVIPSLGIEKELEVGKPVEIDFTPEASGTIAFQCPMGHGKSSIVVLPKAK